MKFNKKKFIVIGIILLFIMGSIGESYSVVKYKRWLTHQGELSIYKGDRESTDLLQDYDTLYGDYHLFIVSPLSGYFYQYVNNHLDGYTLLSLVDGRYICGSIINTQGRIDGLNVLKFVLRNYTFIYTVYFNNSVEYLNQISQDSTTPISSSTSAWATTAFTTVSKTSFAGASVNNQDDAMGFMVIGFIAFIGIGTYLYAKRRNLSNKRLPHSKKPNQVDFFNQTPHNILCGNCGTKISVSDDYCYNCGNENV